MHGWLLVFFEVSLEHSMRLLNLLQELLGNIADDVLKEFSDIAEHVVVLEGSL